MTLYPGMIFCYIYYKPLAYNKISKNGKNRNMRNIWKEISNE